MQSEAMRSPNEEASDAGTSGRHTDLLLHIPPNHFGSISSARGFIPLHSPSKASPSSGGLLRGLSFKKKGSVVDGEKSYLLSADPKLVPGSGSPTPTSARLMSAFSWKRSSSVPVTPVSNSYPSVATPTSARMSGDRNKMNVRAQLNVFVGLSFM